MMQSPPLIAGRLSRRGISGLAIAVLLFTPFQALMQDSLSLYTMLVTRAVALTALLFAVRTEQGRADLRWTDLSRYRAL